MWPRYDRIKIIVIGNNNAQLLSAYYVWGNMLDNVNKWYLFKSEALGSLPIRITRKVFKMYLGPATVSLKMMCLFKKTKNKKNLHLWKLSTQINLQVTLVILLWTYLQHSITGKKISYISWDMIHKIALNRFRVPYIFSLLVIWITTALGHIWNTAEELDYIFHIIKLLNFKVSHQ